MRRESATLLVVVGITVALVGSPLSDLPTLWVDLLTTGAGLLLVLVGVIELQESFLGPDLDASLDRIDEDLVTLEDRIDRIDGRLDDVASTAASAERAAENAEDRSQDARDTAEDALSFVEEVGDVDAGSPPDDGATDVDEGDDSTTDDAADEATNEDGDDASDVDED